MLCQDKLHQVGLIKKKIGIKNSCAMLLEELHEVCHKLTVMEEHQEKPKQHCLMEELHQLEMDFESLKEEENVILLKLASLHQECHFEVDAVINGIKAQFSGLGKGKFSPICQVFKTSLMSRASTRSAPRQMQDEEHDENAPAGS